MQARQEGGESPAGDPPQEGGRSLGRRRRIDGHPARRCATDVEGGKRCGWRAALLDAGMKDSDLWKGGFIEREEGSNRSANDPPRPTCPDTLHLLQ